MPGMDGLEASRIIKRDDRLQHIPKIVMVTAFGREDIRTKAEEIGIDSYLLKPVNSSLLYDTLVDLFGIAGLEGHRSRVKKDDAHVHDATGIRILLVEDNEMNQQVATELLQSAGAVVTVANHGGEAASISNMLIPIWEFSKIERKSCSLALSFSSVRLRSVISRTVTTAPVIVSPSRIGNEEYWTGIGLPSRRQITSVSMQQPSPFLNAR